MLFLRVNTEKDWIKSAAETPLFGSLFIFALIFIPPVISSFIAQALVPGLNDDTRFTKSMLVLLPAWNLLLWLFKIRLFVLFIPAWILFGIVSIVKIIIKDY